MGFLTAFYTGKISTHLWYLYLFIAYLIVLPFLRQLVKGLDNRFFFYMIAIAVFYKGIQPVAEYFITRGEYTLYQYARITWIIDNMVLYPCLGYYLQFRVKLEDIKKYLPWIWSVNIIGIMASCFTTYYRGVVPKANVQTYFSSFAILNCIAVFLTVRYLLREKVLNDTARSIIVSVGKLTFGIYLLHIFVMKRGPVKAVLRFLQGTGMNYMICALVWCLFIMLVTGIMVWCISKVPVAKKLVGF